MTLNKERPVFIVGVPRSGTTLLASLISSHHEISCGPETQFFNQTTIEEREKAVNDPEWPKHGVKLVTQLHLAGKPVFRHFDLSTEDIENYLCEKAPSQRALLESLTVQFSQKQGKRLWAEKTPGHLHHVEEIKRIFPSAKIIHIVRDPRDTSRSMSEVPWASDSLVVNAYRWCEDMRIARDLSCFTMRYEDLLDEPDEVMGSLFRYLNVGPSQADYSVIQPNSSVVAKGEKWKSKVQEPIDPTNAFKWKKGMESHLVETISLICCEGIEYYGYENRATPQKYIDAYGLTRANIESYESAIVEYAKESIFFVPAKLDKNETQKNNDIVVFSLPNIGVDYTERMFKTIGFFQVLLSTLLKRKKVCYLPNRLRKFKSISSWLGYRLLKAIGTDISL